MHAFPSLDTTVPFATAEEAWLWTMNALIARHEGAASSGSTGTVRRPCDPDDVIRSLNRLYEDRRITLLQARVLRSWGERGEAPDGKHLSEREDWELWSDALRTLEWPLRLKGIVADSVAEEQADTGSELAYA